MRRLIPSRGERAGRQARRGARRARWSSGSGGRRAAIKPQAVLMRWPAPRSRAADERRAYRSCARPSASPDSRRRVRGSERRVRGRGCSCGRRAGRPRPAPNAGTALLAWRDALAVACQLSHARPGQAPRRGRPAGNAGSAWRHRSRRGWWRQESVRSRRSAAAPSGASRSWPGGAARSRSGRSAQPERPSR